MGLSFSFVCIGNYLYCFCFRFVGGNEREGVWFWLKFLNVRVVIKRDLGNLLGEVAFRAFRLVEF